MDLSLIEGVLYGLLSGLADILPVSAQAHKLLLLKLFGMNSEPALLGLLIHIGIFAALYFSCQPQIVKILRARSLAKVPKRRRRRPLDTKSLMDYSLWKTMLIPIILGFLFYRKAAVIGKDLLWVSGFLFLNGLLLYIPQFLPGSTKDSRMLSRVEVLLMGLGGAAAVFPGISAIGAATSIANVCGVERSYGLSMALLMNLAVTAGLIIYDLIALFGSGIGILSFGILLGYILAAAAAFGGVVFGVKIMRNLAANSGFAAFAYYCWGGALFTFILNLMA